MVCGKGRMVMFVSYHPRDLTWNWLYQSSHTVLVTSLFSFWWRSKHWFCLFKLIKCTNIAIKDTACLHIVQILQDPTFRSTWKSTQTTMVNALKKNISPLPAGKYGKSTNQSRWRHHQANEGKSRFEAKQVRSLGALRSLWSKKTLAAERRQETNCLNHKENETWIDDYMERETAVARKPLVEDAETAINQEQENIRSAESGGLISKEPKQTLEEMLDAIGDSLSNLASADNQEDGEDN